MRKKPYISKHICSVVDADEVFQYSAAIVLPSEAFVNGTLPEASVLHKAAEASMPYVTQVLICHGRALILIPHSRASLAEECRDKRLREYINPLMQILSAHGLISDAEQSPLTSFLEDIAACDDLLAFAQQCSTLADLWDMLIDKGEYSYLSFIVRMLLSDPALVDKYCCATHSWSKVVKAYHLDSDPDWYRFTKKYLHSINPFKQ